MTRSLYSKTSFARHLYSVWGVNQIDKYHCRQIHAIRVSRLLKCQKVDWRKKTFFQSFMRLFVSGAVVIFDGETSVDNRKTYVNFRSVNYLLVVCGMEKKWYRVLFNITCIILHKHTKATNNTFLAVLQSIVTATPCTYEILLN